MSVIKDGTFTAQSAQDIEDALEDPSVETLIVPEGIYDFAGSPDTLVFDSGLHLIFQGDVKFEDTRLITRAEDDSDYVSNISGTCTWNGASSRFERSGTSWSTAGSDWQLFVRDRWYTASSVTADYFYPNETPVGGGLTSAQHYVLCKPVEYLRIEGNLTLVYDGSSTDEWVHLTGLKNCDLERWNLSVFDCKNMSAASPKAIRCSYSAQTSVPRFLLSHQNHTYSGAGGYGVYCQHLHQCAARGWSIGNLYSGTDVWWGAYFYYCQYSRFSDIVISGVNRDGGAGTVYNFYLKYCRYTYISGVSCGPYSSGGAEIHVTDSDGTSNDTSDILQRAS